MTDQITLKEALKLVSFRHWGDRGWQICEVNSDIYGNVEGHVHGDVWGKINGRKWQFVETPKEKLQRLLDEVSEAELLKLINQLENND